MAADLQSALVDRWSTPQFFLFSCGNNWSRTNFYGFSVRRIDHLCYVSMFFFCCLTRTRTSTTVAQNHSHYRLCYKAIIAESHGFEPYALPRTFGLANQPNSLSVALSKDGRKVESTIPRRFTVPAVFKTVLAYHTS